MNKIRVLLVGESWMTVNTHYKGFDYFTSTVYEDGLNYFKKAFEAVKDVELIHMPGHCAAEDFPNTIEELNQYQVIIISDIGANTLLLSKKVFLEGKRSQNRLRLIQQWTEDGGGFCMCGGYMSFSGINAAAKYYRTPIEEILPVNMYPFDDRVETPEGAEGIVLLPDHPILADVDTNWPILLGYQEVTIKDNAELLVKTQYDHPLVAAMNYGKGRSLAWMTDIGPHWCPKEFAEWDGYTKFWKSAVYWLAGR